MKSSFKLLNADKLECELKVTMTLEDWRLVKQELAKSHPSVVLARAIGDMIYQAEQVFYPSEPKEQ